MKMKYEKWNNTMITLYYIININTDEYMYV